MNLICKYTSKYRIGVDVGGTNTDAAILEVDTHEPSVCASTKTPTTPDISSGISTAIENVLSESHVERDDVLSVAIGTTHFVNAIVEADASLLSKVAVVRLCGPFARMAPPFAEFPPVLKGIMGGPAYYLDGGLEIDGREIAPLNSEQIKTTVRSIQQAGIKYVALVGIFSAVDYNGIHEDSCKKQMLELDPSLSIVCSHSIGGIGLLERENATILNASILHLASKTIRSFQEAMAQLQLKCTLYLTQNDGTLTDAASAAELPIKTIASGPTNSMTGAAFLAALGSTRPDTQLLVMDIGGTTSDVCALLPSGFPRPAPNFVEIGGVKTAFAMPDVQSIGLGGGSVVHVDLHTGTVTLGPESVGHELTKKSLVFGGNVLTATDIVVACGKADIGDKTKVRDLPKELVLKAREEIRRMLEGVIDEMKISAKPATVLLVGGGAILQMDPLRGVSECIIPPHHGSANAVGAAIAKVVGEVDIIAVLANRDEEEVVEEAKQRAIEAAIAKGADPDDVKIVEVTKVPLAYVTGKAARLVIKAVGRLSAEPAKKASPEVLVNIPALGGGSNNSPSINSSSRPSIPIDLGSYRPDVRDHVWYISATDLGFIATGTGVLGTGGGGPSRLQYLECIDVLQRPGTEDIMRVVPLTSINDLDTIVSGSWYGAPSVAGERIPAGTELATAMEACVRLTGQKEAHAAVTAEIGGGNGLSAFPLAVASDIPVVDGDLMGRAFPTMAHSLPLLYGWNVLPCALADGRKNVAVVTNAESNRRIETMLRVLCEDMGSQAAVSAAPFTGEVIKKYSVPNTISQAWYIGRAIHSARDSKKDIIQAIFDTCPGKLLFTGKIVDVKRDVSKGYTMGTCVIAPLTSDERETSSTRAAPSDSRYLVVPFQNEFLYAALADPKAPTDISNQEVICTVPDLISILGQDGEALGSQELRYGLKVHVIGMPAHPLWTTEKALNVGGPKGFGLEMEWSPLGGYRELRSVAEEFNQ